jgi:isopentenyl-diphosphate Delta-isomerase
VNPLQEWLQPEGDRFQRPPLHTVSTMLQEMPELKIIVKEVGQGMGYESLRALFQLPLQAVDFAASGGTNFAKLELLRSDKSNQEIYQQLAQVGHTAAEMVDFTNQLKEELGNKMLCQQVIISGGIGSFLDGYYLTNKLHLPSVYGQASGFLKHARGEYDELRDYVAAQVRGLEVAKAFLKVK